MLFDPPDRSKMHPNANSSVFFPEQVPEKHEKVLISCDSTNKDGQAREISMVETGRTKGDLTGPMFNVTMAYDRTNSAPLFYDESPARLWTYRSCS